MWIAEWNIVRWIASLSRGSVVSGSFSTVAIRSIDATRMRSIGSTTRVRFEIQRGRHDNEQTAICHYN